MKDKTTNTKRAPLHKGANAAQRRRQQSALTRIQDMRMRRISGVAKEATREAFETSLAAGLNVHIIEGAAVYRVTPDGKRSLVKEIAPPVQARRGSKRTLR